MTAKERVDRTIMAWVGEAVAVSRLGGRGVTELEHFQEMMYDTVRQAELAMWQRCRDTMFAYAERYTEDRDCVYLPMRYMAEELDTIKPQ